MEVTWGRSVNNSILPGLALRQFLNDAMYVDDNYKYNNLSKVLT